MKQTVAVEVNEGADEVETVRNSILILGSGESGKSTIVKQLCYLYGLTFRDEYQKRQFVVHIHENINQGIRDVVTEIGDEIPEYLIQYANRIKARTTYDPIRGEDADCILKLWNHSFFRNKYSELKYKLHLPDGLEHLLDRVQMICQSSYIPTPDDIFHVRKRTTGIIEANFDVDNAKYTAIDVGGQQNERRKWVYVFENVNCLIYVHSLPTFDQLMWEDSSKNRLEDSLESWENVLNHKIFKDRDIFLFLNKRDIFEEKLKKINLQELYDDYEGEPHDYDAGCKYMSELFLKRNKNEKRKIFTNYTNAIDSTNVHDVFADVFKFIKKLKE